MEVSSTYCKMEDRQQVLVMSDKEVKVLSKYFCISVLFVGLRFNISYKTLSVILMVSGCDTTASYIILTPV